MQEVTDLLQRGMVVGHFGMTALFELTYGPAGPLQKEHDFAGCLRVDRFELTYGPAGPTQD